MEEIGLKTKLGQPGFKKWLAIFGQPCLDTQVIIKAIKEVHTRCHQGKLTKASEDADMAALMAMLELDASAEQAGGD